VRTYTPLPELLVVVVHALAQLDVSQVANGEIAFVQLGTISWDWQAVTSLAL
jgi:hypothetical protein